MNASEITLEEEDTEFWEWQFCLVFTNPDSHKLLSIVSPSEAINALTRYC